jgi:hypothetical protein
MPRPRSIYEIDPYNRLVVNDAGRKSLIPKFRIVLDGQFYTDHDNSLYYHVKAPVSGAQETPSQIKFKGVWSLTKDHTLRFTLDRSSRAPASGELTIEGEILDVNDNSLLFAVTTLSDTGTRTTYVLTLQGSWKVDENNRLTFQLRRERGIYDILTFNCAWEINDGNQLIYRYEKAELLRKKRTTHTLVFKGHWDIKENLRISYLLGVDSENAITFNASASVFEKNYVKYQVGIGLSGSRRPVRNSITLSGVWKVYKDTGLLFEVKYADGSVSSIVFGAEARLTDRDTISFRLRDEIRNRDIGVELELTRKFLKGDGEAFLRFIKDREEVAILAGAGWRW